MDAVNRHRERVAFFGAFDVDRPGGWVRVRHGGFVSHIGFGANLAGEGVLALDAKAGAGGDAQAWLIETVELIAEPAERKMFHGYFPSGRILILRNQAASPWFCRAIGQDWFG